MGQKVNPIGLRLGVNKIWDSRWFAGKEYGDLLLEDIKIRKFLNDKLRFMGISRIVIERPAKKANVSIYTSKPGVVIGKKGADIEALKKAISKMTKSEVSLNIVEVRKPDVEAKISADSIAQQIEKRISFRKAMKKAVQSAFRQGAKGIRVNCSGRLAGAEIARTEWYREGRVPLHTLRSDVDYSTSTARTAAGAVGIKVWIYRGDVVGEEKIASERQVEKLNIDEVKNEN